MKPLQIILVLIVFALSSCDSSKDNPTPAQEDICSKTTVTGQVACIPFSGNANENITGKRGEAVGAMLTADRKGNTNSAYSFDGLDDYIQINDPPIDFNGSFSLVMWAMIDDNAPESGIIRFMDSRSSSFMPNASLNVYLKLSSAQLIVAGLGISVFDFDYDTGNWFQMAIVYDEVDEEAEVYINGIQLPNIEEGFEGFDYNGNPLIIGARADIKEVFPGKIDDISFFDKDLEESEIAQLLFQ